MGFQIAPMVDVVFVLLLFFMASAGAQVVEKELGVNLPSGATSSANKAPTTPQVIDIAPDGQVTMNDQPLGNPTDKELPQLRAQLRRILDQFPEDPVIIRPAGETLQERVMDVLNACAAAKVKNLSFS